MDNRLHIALITTWYPPRQGVAVNRMRAFAGYPDPEKFRVTVFSLGEEDAPLESPAVYRVKNSSKLKRLKERPGESSITHKLKVLWNVTMNRLFPFEFQSWRKNVVKKLQIIHQTQPFDIVISSFSPVESHLAAADFAARYPKVFWVADMRDEMSANRQITERTREMLRNVERQINARANLVTTVSAPILNDFRKIMPSVAHFLEIRNGFDHKVSIHLNHNKIFTISYAGTFYGTRKPVTFFKGLQAFLKKFPVEIELQFIGTHHNFSIPAGIEKFCRFYAPMPNAEAIELIARSDANLLVLPPVESKGIYSGKIFDYLSVRKPIIAVVDTSDVAAELIREYQAGFVAEFNNIGQISQAIESAYLLWKDRRFLPESPLKTETLHRRYQVEKLCNALLEWTGN